MLHSLMGRSPACDRLLGMLNEYDERESEYRNNPMRVPGEELCVQLQQRARGCGGDGYRIVLGWKQYDLLTGFATCHAERFGNKATGGRLVFRGIPVHPAGDDDYIGVFRVLPYRWVEVT